MELPYKQYWSRKPGVFVIKRTGEIVHCAAFTGRTREWYECFWESLIDIVNTIKPEECSLYAHPDACLLLEGSVLFKLEPKYENFQDPQYRGQTKYLEKNMKLYEVETQQRNLISVKNKNNEVVGELEILDM